MSLKDLSRPTTEIKRTVTEAESGARLDHVLAGWITWRSRQDLQERIRGGTVTVNGKPSKAAARVRRGDVITVHVTPEPGARVDEAAIEIRVLHEEAAFVFARADERAARR